MSTRSVIARAKDKGFEGVYHHWDGYPSGLGEALFKLRNGKFKGDTDKMLKHLIDDHPAGWSTIMDVNPKCFCHRKDSIEKEHKMTQENASGCGCEWAYVFRGNVMEVWSSYCALDRQGCGGEKMIGMFGMGDPNAFWMKTESVDLDGPEPDWEKIEEKANEHRS